MKPDWRVMVTGYKGATGRWAAFYVTMNRKGEIVLSGPTWQKMGEPKAVHLLFDTVNNRIGLKPTVPALANAVFHSCAGWLNVRAASYFIFTLPR